MRFILIACVLLTAPACDFYDTVDDCDSFVWEGPAIVVSVIDAETGEQLSDGVSVLGEGLGRTDEFELVQYNGGPLFEGFSHYTGDSNSPAQTGSYTVTVSADGYEQAVSQVEVVASDLCFSTPRPYGAERVNVELTPTAR